MSDTDQAFRDAASDRGLDGVDFDEDAKVSVSEDGAYVQAWVWVSNEAAGVEPEDDDDGCPKGDLECLGNNGDCHDACESPA